MMILRRAFLLAFVATTASATPITFSVTADSVYSNPSNPIQAYAYVNQAFPFSLSVPTTLTFSATYTQTLHSCIGATCSQDLNTFAYTQSGLYFNSAPHLNICNKFTGALFPCSATLPAGNYDLVLIINDTTSTQAFIGNVVYPFSDTMTVTVDGLPSAVPEPSTMAVGVLGAAFLGALRYRKLRDARKQLFGTQLT
jgi:hypothetical protein